MSFAKINNIECYYEIHGEGRPLVLIAGLASDSESWRLVLGPLKKRFKVIIFDNRGVGRTKDPGGPLNISDMAKDTVALMDHLGIENAHILGHSMGGFIAQDIAITYPERVNKVILACTAPALSDKVQILLGDILFKIYTRDDKYEDFIKDFIKWLFTPAFLHDKKKTSQFIKYVLTYPYRQNHENFKRQFEACGKYRSVDRLKRFKSETLLISAGKDMVISEAETNLLNSKIPDSKIKHIPKSAHSVQTEFPKQFAKDVIEFLT